MNNEINLDRFAMLLNNQADLRTAWVKQKVAERREKARIVSEKKKRLKITPFNIK